MTAMCECRPDGACVGAANCYRAAGEPAAPPLRQRLPERREQISETVRVERGDGRVTLAEVSVGFHPQTGRPKEVFIAGARPGTDNSFEWADIGVALSVALQSGVSATAMVRSAASMPDGTGELGRVSVTGVVLDLVAAYEREAWSAGAATPEEAPAENSGAEGYE